jgi:hypothetical protein
LIRSNGFIAKILQTGLSHKDFTSWMPMKYDLSERWLSRS